MSDDAKLTPYQQHLVTEHLGLAQKTGLIAWRRASVSPLPSLPTPEKYEFVGIAYQGLIAAALTFDPDWRPEEADPNYDPLLAFGPFAKRRIIGKIMDWQRQLDHVPKRQRKVYKTLESNGHGSGKTPEELSDITGLDVNKIRAITKAVEENSLDLDAVPPHSDSEIAMHESISYGTTSVEQHAIASQIQAALADTIRSMPSLQRAIVVCRYYSGHDLSTIAEMLGVRLSQVRSLHSDAVELIHRSMREAAS